MPYDSLKLVARSLSFAALATSAWGQTPEIERATDSHYPLILKAFRTNISSIKPPSGSRAAWNTEHFTLLSDQDIHREALQQFANTLESLPSLLEKHPLPLWSPIEDQPAVIRLCRDAERFEDLGGPDGSAGYFDARKNEILIRADLFLSPPGSSTRLTQPPDEGLLVHETCHLAMAGTLRGTRPWLKEGLAEYFSVAHQRGGHYRFDLFDRNLPKHLRRHLALQGGEIIALPPLEEVLETSDREWSRMLDDARPEERYLPYAVSLLFIHYQLNGGGVRREQFEEFIADLSERHPTRGNRPNLDVPNPAEIERQLVRYWSGRGLKLEFEPSAGKAGDDPVRPTPSPPAQPVFPNESPRR